MLQIIDASEGPFDSGRFPEAAAIGALAGTGGGPVLGLGPRSNALAGLVEPGRVIGVHCPVGPLRVGERLDRPGLVAWGRRPGRWALRQDASVDLSLELLEGPTRVTSETRRWARVLGGFRRITVRDEADARGWLACGVPGARLRCVNPESTGPAGGAFDRSELRERLAVEDDEFLVFPLAAPWSALDAQRLVFLLGLLRINGLRAGALIPASAWRLASARHFGRVAGTGARVIVIDGAMTPWLPGCDAAFLDAARPRDRLTAFAPRGALRVLMCAAERAGVPLAVAPGSLIEEHPARAPSVAAELRALARIGEARLALAGGDSES